MGDIAQHWSAPLRRVGAYDLRTLIGRGGTASVYQAVRTTDGASAAVKVLHPHLAHDRVSTARFLREGRALSQIVHPNIVAVLEAGGAQGTPYLVMSLVEGDDLSDHLRRLHPMPLRRIVECMSPVIDAVATAHEAGVIHRDLKPRNIRIKRSEDGGVVPMVLDFGLSKWVETDPNQDLTATGEALGTVSYMAPEQLLSARRVDERTDIYALGVILYESATARRPFQGQTAYEVMHDIQTAEVVPPSVYRPDLPSDFESLVLRAMRRDPSERFASARELGAALAGLSSFKGAGESERPRRASGRVKRPPRFEGSYGAWQSDELGFEIVRFEESDVSIWLAGTQDFSGEGWTHACLAVADSIRSRDDDPARHGVLVVTDGAAPNTKQRREWSQLVLRGNTVRNAVVTTAVRTNPLKRGVATALHWLNRGFRVFEPDEIVDAFRHVNLASDQFDVVLASLARMQRQMLPVKALRLAAHRLGLPVDGADSTSGAR